jgi:hypothetical protein
MNKDAKGKLKDTSADTKFFFTDLLAFVVWDFQFVAPSNSGKKLTD